MFFGGVTAKQFAQDLKAVGAVQKINLHLNTSGGDVFDGFAIYNLLVSHAAKVVSYIDGLAASIGSVIAMAGDEIKIAENGFLMIHDAWGMTAGSAEDLRRTADLLDTTTGAIADVYVGRTKNPMDKIRKWMKDETWFTGREALDAGFADSMVENLKIAAKFDPNRHKFRNAPRALLAPPSTGPTPLRAAATTKFAAMKANFELKKSRAV